MRRRGSTGPGSHGFIRQLAPWGLVSKGPATAGKPMAGDIRDVARWPGDSGDIRDVATQTGDSGDIRDVARRSGDSGDIRDAEGQPGDSGDIRDVEGQPGDSQEGNNKRDQGCSCYSTKLPKEREREKRKGKSSFILQEAKLGACATPEGCCRGGRIASSWINHLVLSTGAGAGWVGDGHRAVRLGH